MKNSLKSTIFLTIAAVLSIHTSVLGRATLTEVEQKVRDELLRIPYYGVFDSINFHIHGTKVVLTGQVTRPSVKRSAEGAINRLNSVSAVQNDLEVLPLSINDRHIRNNLFRSLYSGGHFLHYGTVHAPVRIIVKNGNVRLVGTVSNKFHKNLAHRKATNTPGVFSVTDDLLIP
jgi:hyperosmotically inducible protein